MKELYVGRVTAQSENGVDHSYDYSVLIDEMRVGNGFFCESYGVKVSAGDAKEVAMIPNITVSISRIDELTELLLRNVVTPCTLVDVVSDWL